MKAMEMFLTAYSFIQSSGSCWEHKARTSMATSSGEKLKLPEWVMKADFNSKMRGKQVNLLA